MQCSVQQSKKVSKETGHLFRFDIRYCFVITLAKYQNRPKTQNTSPNFGYMVQKCWTKVRTVEKRNFYDVLFCKFKLSEMASVKQNKNKKLDITSEDQLFMTRNIEQYSICIVGQKIR